MGFRGSEICIFLDHWRNSRVLVEFRWPHCWHLDTPIYIPFGWELGPRSGSVIHGLEKIRATKYDQACMK